MNNNMCSSGIKVSRTKIDDMKLQQNYCKKKMKDYQENWTHERVKKIKS